MLHIASQIRWLFGTGVGRVFWSKTSLSHVLGTGSGSDLRAPLRRSRYQRALTLDPQNKAAKKGLSNVERLMQGLDPEDGDDTADEEGINNSETEDIEADQEY